MGREMARFEAARRVVSKLILTATVQQPCNRLYKSCDVNTIQLPVGLKDRGAEAEVSEIGLLF
jgi:hypothetical protein